MAFDGVGDGLRREDERAAKGHAKQQPASTMRGQEDGTTRGQQEMMARQPAAPQDNERWHDEMTTRRDDERAVR